MQHSKAKLKGNGRRSYRFIQIILNNKCIRQLLDCTECVVDLV